MIRAGTRILSSYERCVGHVVAARFARSSGAVRVCWDLDNTLVDSGKLLRTGIPLGRAAIDAAPMRNMLEFHASLRAELSGARHIYVTARRRALRRPTVRWLERHALLGPADALCFLPTASAKPQVWRRLARGAPLVIIDDLCWGHEGEVRVHHDLVQEARSIAFSYVGSAEIAAVAKDAAVAQDLIRAIAAALPGHGLGGGD